MNPRRVHELMRKHFPLVEHAARQWSVVQNESGPNIPAISSLLAEHIASTEVIVEVHRKLGALLPISEAAAYIGAHIGEGEIRVADRDFSRFVVVGANGVASGWSHAGCCTRRPTAGFARFRPRVNSNVGRHKQCFALTS